MVKQNQGVMRWLSGRACGCIVYGLVFASDWCACPTSVIEQPQKGKGPNKVLFLINFFVDPSFSGEQAPTLRVLTTSGRQSTKKKSPNQAETMSAVKFDKRDFKRKIIYMLGYYRTTSMWALKDNRILNFGGLWAKLASSPKFYCSWLQSFQFREEHWPDL